MKHAVLFCVFIFCTNLWATNPEVEISLGRNSTLYYGETVNLLVRMSYYNLREHTLWSIPSGSSLQALSSACPSIPHFTGKLKQGTCDMNLIVHGDTMGKIIQGPVLFSTYWSGKQQTFASAPIYIQVIPHNLSIHTIPFQEATANTPFICNMKSFIKFYDENQLANQIPQGVLTPAEQNGLYFDPASFSIKGTPQKTGTYLFKFHVQNTQSITTAEHLIVKVNPNEKDKPLFKPHPAMASALRGKKYSMNLMELIEPHSSFMISNQISFRLDKSKNNPHWLAISEEDARLLIGNIPSEFAGKDITLTLIATSNTGGDSDPLEITIPIAVDPSKKPIIKAFEIEQLAHSPIAYDLSEHIVDPSHDPKLKMLLDKIEPAAPWLRISSENPLKLVGTIPENHRNNKYTLTVRANNSSGGSSKSLTVPLYIIQDKNLAPHIQLFNPLPLLYPGQPYFYDFANNNDIYPLYTEFPYEVRFAKEYTPPSWLHLDNNHLYADQVPFGEPDQITIRVVLRNAPGGGSEEYSLDLTMHK